MKKERKAKKPQPERTAGLFDKEIAKFREQLDRIEGKVELVLSKVMQSITDKDSEDEEEEEDENCEEPQAKERHAIAICRQLYMGQGESHPTFYRGVTINKHGESVVWTDNILEADFFEIKGDKLVSDVYPQVKKLMLRLIDGELLTENDDPYIASVYWYADEEEIEGGPPVRLKIRK